MDGPDSELSPKFAPFIGMVCLDISLSPSVISKLNDAN